MKTLLIILLLSTTPFLNAQNFEGILTYVNDFEVSQELINNGVTKELLRIKMESEGGWADTIKTTYKDGFYKQLHILSKNDFWLIYRSDSNNLYSFQNGEDSDYCLVNDASIDPEYEISHKRPKVTLLDTLVEYKGFKLKLIEVKWEATTYSYLYNDKYFKANPESYKGHFLEGFNDFLKISKSFPIIIIKQMGMMTITTSLIDSLEKGVVNSTFRIPEFEEKLEIDNGNVMKIKK